MMVLFACSGAMAQDVVFEGFVKRYWYQRGIAHGNPNFNRSVRVNSPESVLDPRFGKRVETRGNGMMQILMEEDLDSIDGAVLYCELWGGHPGTSNKMVSINGRSAYPIPETGTEQNHCTYQYPRIPLKISDLVNGYNAIQFSCEQGTSFWGHFMVDNACLELKLKNGYDQLRKLGVHDFTGTVVARPAGPDAIDIELATSGLNPDEIASVEYFGYYKGFDDDGNGLDRDWHGYTKEKLFQNTLGRSDKAPFKITWSTLMLPAQNRVKIRAEVRFKSDSSIVYLTRELKNLEIPVRPKAQVSMFGSYDMPAPFWSRANNLKTCTIFADVQPKKIERAELHVLIWDGGEGSVADHFKFNGKPFPLASGKHGHDVIYRIFEVDPSLIRAGENTIELLSDTEHHGIEILLPGPLLIVRSAR